MKQQHSGFTLVELVTTVTIVGVLSAVALPRFANVNTDARAGVIKNLASAMKQSNDAIYAKASSANITSLAAGLSAGTVGVNFPNGRGGFTFINTAFGYASNASELYNAMVQNPDLAVGTDASTVTSDTIASLQKVNGDLVVTQAIAPNSAIQHQRVKSPTTCEVGYTAAKSSDTAPVYITVISDCS